MTVSPFERLQQLLAPGTVILAPMEDVSDAVFRRICRELGANLCVTEFVNVEGLLRGCSIARKKITLAADDQPTVIQIYGSDATRLMEAAVVAEQSNPVAIDINCGCWVPKVAGKGAGAAWLRNPQAMVEMASRIVQSVSLPVTVKTRIGYGPESDMPIIDLARRLEDVGVQALTVHCRTAAMGHTGAADWSWARRAQEVVRMPVIVNGDVRSGADAERAMRETGCPGVMIGRRAIEYPWVFAEARARLDRGVDLPPPTPRDKIALARRHLADRVNDLGERLGVLTTRRHFAGYLRGIAHSAELRRSLLECPTQAGCLAILDRLEQTATAHAPVQAEPFVS